MVGAALVLPMGSPLGSGSGCAPLTSASGPFSLWGGWRLQGGPRRPGPHPHQSPPIRLPHPERAHLSGWALGGGVGAGSVKTCSVRGPGRTAAASASLGPASGTSVASVASSVDGAGLTFPLATAGTSPVEERGERRRPRAWPGTHPGAHPPPGCGPRTHPGPHLAPRCPQGPGLTLALIQHRGVPRAQDSPWPSSSTEVSPGPRTHPGPRPALGCPLGPGLTLALVQHWSVPQAQDSPWPLSSTGVSPREEQLLRGTLQRVAQPTSVMPASTPSAPESSGFTSLSRKISPGG